MASYKYDKARTTDSIYDFARRSEGEVNVDDDFWGGMGDDAAVDEEKNKKGVSLLHRIRQCLVSIVDFYRPSPSFQKSGTLADPEFPLDLDFTTTSNNEREIKSLYIQLRTGASLLCAVSLFFGCWAVINTLSMDEGQQDLGMYSFLTTFMSSHYLLWRTRKPSSGTGIVATTLTRLLVTASHVFVFLNYCLGVAFAYTVGSHAYHIFGLYCITFSGLWGYVAYRGFTLLSSLQKQENEVARSADDGERFDGDGYF